MMKKHTVSAIALFVFLACTSNPDKPLEDGKINSLSDLEAVGQRMEEASSQANSRWEERRAKGDTVALPYKELQQFLPDNVDGYAREGGPSGTQTNVPGMGSWSEAKQNYARDEERKLEIKIVDYNSAMSAFGAMTSFYSLGFSSEDDYKKEAAVDLGVKDVVAYETVYKTNPRSSMVLIVADRFLITLENNGAQDEELLRRVVKDIDLAKMVGR